MITGRTQYEGPVLVRKDERMLRVSQIDGTATLVGPGFHHVGALHTVYLLRPDTPVAVDGVYQYRCLPLEGEVRVAFRVAPASELDHVDWTGGALDVFDRAATYCEEWARHRASKCAELLVCPFMGNLADAIAAVVGLHVGLDPVARGDAEDDSIGAEQELDAILRRIQHRSGVWRVGLGALSAHVSLNGLALAPAWRVRLKETRQALRRLPVEHRTAEAQFLGARATMRSAEAALAQLWGVDPVHPQFLDRLRQLAALDTPSP